MSAGLAIGVAADNISFWMPVGTAVGLMLGTVGYTVGKPGPDLEKGSGDQKDQKERKADKDRK